MAKILVIVESPAKMKTLRKFLGSNYAFASSVGHIRDLPERGFGIDVETDFEPQYETLPDKQKVIQELIKAAKTSDLVLLAPDPDREGEAIAWHIAAILPKGTKIKRTSFHSITKQAVEEALKHPTEIDLNLVNAQQARRLLDRIVGYKISPILARRVRGGRRGNGVSAGRVQSVALKLVVDREHAIREFAPVEYWSLYIDLRKVHDGNNFRAAIYSIDGKRVEKEPEEGKEAAVIPNAAAADLLEARLKKAKLHVASVDRKEKRRNPVAPFITSSLQQEASRHFRFSPQQTMTIAQQLYEGIDMEDEGTEGLITYMRTDSVRIAPEALQAARELIEKTYGAEYLPQAPRTYSTKKSAQDAHEAIRPTNLHHPPERVKQWLTRPQHQLYSLIWKRFLASQMNPAIYDTVTVDVETDVGLRLRATGSTLKFRGFLAMYEEKLDEDETGGEAKELPHLGTGDLLKIEGIEKEQSFTRPPPRFTEASLVKELERSGIGRPSTYAAIMNKIQSRAYTIKEKHRLRPTELGEVCAALLEAAFPQIMNTTFTADMEDTLELIAGGETEWKKVIRDFWEQFIPFVDRAEKEAFVPRIDTDLPCPKCGKHLQKIWSHSKYFYGCSGYPECDYSAPIEELAFNKEEYAPDFDWDQKCPVCDSEMKVRHSRFGAFLGCTRFPECRGTVTIPKRGEELVSTEELPNCPAISCPGKIQPRRSRFGKIFFSCSTFPECDVIVNKLEDLSTKYPDHPRTPYERKKPTKQKGSKKSAKGAARRGASSQLSAELAAVVGETELPRGQVMKKLWEYIKEHNLQDPKDKRVILPDEKLGKVFGSREPVGMFQLAGLISKHLHR